MNTKKTLVKLSNGCRNDGRTVDGEYDGGVKEALWFAANTTGGTIRVMGITKAGDLYHVRTVR